MRGTRTVYVQLIWSASVKEGRRFGRIETSNFWALWVFGRVRSAGITVGLYLKEPRCLRGWSRARATTEEMRIVFLGLNVGVLSVVEG